VPKKPLFGHGISGIEGVAVDKPEARQVPVARQKAEAVSLPREVEIRFYRFFLYLKSKSFNS
jgi:hypothetical protein